MEVIGGLKFVPSEMFRTLSQDGISLQRNCTAVEMDILAPSNHPEATALPP